jgi:hypothetical protein
LNDPREQQSPRSCPLFSDVPIRTVPNDDAPKNYFNEPNQSDLPRQLFCLKISSFQKCASSVSSRHPAPSEGRYGQSSRSVARDAMDVGRALDERDRPTDGEIVWS